MKPLRQSSAWPNDSLAAQSSAAGLFFHQQILTTLECAIARTRAWLIEHQHADGHWAGELEGDTILESEYILLLAFLGQHDSPTAHKAARYLLKQQLDRGGWANYPGGPVDVSASVKAYFALKLTGHDPSSAVMERARAVRSTGSVRNSALPRRDSFSMSSMSWPMRRLAARTRFR